MGGNGTFGGGGKSCFMDFEINGVETWHADHDPKVRKKFWVMVEFPKKKVVNPDGSVVAWVTDKDRITVSWPAAEPIQKKKKKK